MSDWVLHKPFFLYTRNSCSQVFHKIASHEKIFRKEFILSEIAFSGFKPAKTEAVFQRCSIKKLFSEISQNSQENICARVSFLIKLQTSATLLKRRLWRRCFPVNFAKFLRTTLFTEHLRWLLLQKIIRLFTCIFLSFFQTSFKKMHQNCLFDIMELGRLCYFFTTVINGHCIAVALQRAFVLLFCHFASLSIFSENK